MAYNKRIEYIIKAENRARRSPFLALVNNHQNKEDMKLYYVEKKMYYIGDDNQDHQCADGGEMPMLYRTQLGATLKGEQLINEYKSFYNAHVVFIEELEHPSKISPIWRCQLSAPSYNLRIELAIYKTESLNC